MGLVDYAGSDSDNDQEEEAPITNKSPIQKVAVADEELFFDDNKKDDASSRFTANSEDILEEIVKPKDWELKLAEKSRRKLEKKAIKKALKKEKKLAKKEKKEKIAKIATGVKKDGKAKAKVVISALGGLTGIVGHNSSDESDGEEETVFPKQKIGNGFLSTLPAPKGRDNRSDGPSSFTKSLIPPSVAKKAGSVQLLSAPTPAPAPNLVNFDSDDDDDETTDFFGFSSAPPKQQEISSDVPLMAVNSSMDVVGPSRPTEDDAMDPTEMYRLPEEEQHDTPSASDQWLHRKISDEQAHKLLMRFSHDIGPEERRSINEMASSLVDVNVDAALGPDVKTNIIKNLGHRAFVEQTSAPIPQVQTQGQMSRRKHQITYLASLAVAREEQLKDQWADQKQSKRMARQKYGF